MVKRKLPGEINMTIKSDYTEHQFKRMNKTHLHSLKHEQMVRALLAHYMDFSKFPKKLTQNIYMSINYIAHKLCYQYEFTYKSVLLYSSYVDLSSINNLTALNDPTIFNYLDNSLSYYLRENEYWIQHYPELLI